MAQFQLIFDYLLFGGVFRWPNNIINFLFLKMLEKAKEDGYQHVYEIVYDVIIRTLNYN